jgi:cell division protein FtsB
MSKLGLNLLGMALVIVLLVLQYRLWFESGGMRDMARLKQTIALQSKNNHHLKKSNEEILFQIQRLQNSEDATESRARNELGMIKKDETFYQIVK